MKKDKLRECPFCGCEAHTIGEVSHQWEVECMNPSCQIYLPTGSGEFFTSEEAAIKAWNRRTSNISIEEIVSKLKELASDIQKEINHNIDKPNIGKRGCLQRVLSILKLLEDKNDE